MSERYTATRRCLNLALDIYNKNNGKSLSLDEFTTAELLDEMNSAKWMKRFNEIKSGEELLKWELEWLVNRVRKLKGVHYTLDTDIGKALSQYVEKEGLSIERQAEQLWNEAERLHESGVLSFEIDSK